MKLERKHCHRLKSKLTIFSTQRDTKNKKIDTT